VLTAYITLLLCAECQAAYSTFKVCYYALYVCKNMLFVPAVTRKPKVFSDREAFLLMYDMPLLTLLQKEKKKKKNYFS